MFHLHLFILESSQMKDFLAAIASCCVMLAVVECSSAQSFIEYPNHPQTYGDHTVSSAWAEGAAGVTVTFDSDDATMHLDGNGLSQRTARNTQNFEAPAAANNPQNLDDPFVVDNYGTRLPLLQQMSASGTSVLTYSFDSALTQAVDIFITDVDKSDAVRVSAFDSGGNALDMRQWSLLAEGDLSNFKDTGTVFSSVEAPTPTTTFSADEIALTAVNDTNYNRSYSIFRSSGAQALSRVEITFTGQQNSPSRDAPNTGAHIYTAVSTASAVPDPEIILGDCNLDGDVNFLDISFFITILSDSDYLSQADTNEDGVVNFFDISPFIAILSL